MQTRRVTLIFLLIGTFWAILILIVAFTGKRVVYSSNKSLAEASASAFLDQTVNTRTWNASHGGVYVPLTDETPVNPYLNVPEKIITTDGGDKLTLINPAYMTRQIFELFEENQGIEGKITSLDLINPKNAPDEWEEKALLTFESGAEEASEVVGLDGTKILRFMVPLTTEESCLRCHAEQGYEVGDIRGGLSLKLPYSPYIDASTKTFFLFLFLLIVIGLFGFVGLYLSWYSIHRLLRNLYITNTELQESVEKNILLRREADHRIKNNLFLVESVISLKMMENGDSSEQLYTHLEEIRSKIDVVATLHDILHSTSQETDKVDLKGLLTKIVETTVRQFADNLISYDMQIIPYEVDSGSAVTYGMILTEMLLNALKHGDFSNDEKYLGVYLFYDKEDLLLTVSNPFTKRKKSEKSSFGSELINSLAETLGGTLSFDQKEDYFVVTCRVPTDTV
ncbi:MAG: DUF3365 domain-containing protein [Spirochaetaceae bacterium]|nr:DUF3365 domain-containing protein [Spirochaetaceae bacterium]MCF7938667.1 DUF3365 domain-containing protein [Spirochaetales bacterium]